MKVLGVTLKDPIERGLKGIQTLHIQLSSRRVTLKDPIERGLKEGCSLAVVPSTMTSVTLKDPIERGLKASPSKITFPTLCVVTLKDPIERGLKDIFTPTNSLFRFSYTQRPDRKGTERLSIHPLWKDKKAKVTLKDPIERGLKVPVQRQIGRSLPESGYTQRPDRKGTESFHSGSPEQLLRLQVTLKDPIERGLKDGFKVKYTGTATSSYTQRPDRKGTERKTTLRRC